jgi:hypothetical protein
MEYYFTPSDRAKIQTAINEIRQFSSILTSVRRRRTKPGGRQLPLYQLIRGEVNDYGATDGSQPYTELENVIEFEEDAILPRPEPIKVAVDGAVLASGDIVWAAYHKEYLTDPDTVDWVRIPTAEGAPPLRRFEIVEGKYTTDQDVFVRWLDFDGNMVGDPDYPTLIYDPEELFAGQAANYLPESYPKGFRGTALVRADLNEYTSEEYALEAPRWEIIGMEGWAKWITATYEEEDYTFEDIRKEQPWFRFTGVFNYRGGWDRKPPQNVGEPIRWADDVEDPLVEPIIGDTVLLKLVDADGWDYDEVPVGWEDQPWMPLYLPVAVFERNQLVMVAEASDYEYEYETPEGSPINKTGDVFPGRRGNSVGIFPSTFDFTSTCWITDLADQSTLPNHSKYIGRFVGLYNPDPEGEYGGDERPRFAIRSGGTGGGDVIIALIEDDIEGITEDDPPTKLEQSDCDALNLWGFTPVTVELKYYIDDSDYGYAGGEHFILATEEGDSYDYGCPVYSTRTFYYLDAKRFETGTYTRQQYEAVHDDLGENDLWPPEGTNLEEHWKRRYRVLTINSVIMIRTCKVLPPPSISEVLGGS